jgi:hypothetical protein
MARKAKDSAKESDRYAELISRGAENVKKENCFGDTKSGWWIDDVYLGKSTADALRVIHGN